MHIGFVSINLYLLTICQCDFHSHSKNGQKKIPNELEKKREDEKKRVGSALYSAPIPDYIQGVWQYSADIFISMEDSRTWKTKAK